MSAKFKTTVQVINYAGRRVGIRPLESHLFKPHPHSDYLCKDCMRPRALHAIDNFVGLGLSPVRVNMTPQASYRGLAVTGKRCGFKVNDKRRERLLRTARGIVTARATPALYAD